MTAPDPHLGQGHCPCVRGAHRRRVIALTGGPGAGKTAILELARKVFCRHVALMPEAATIVYGGGFWRSPTQAGVKAAQRAIFHVQRELETLLRREDDVNLILCDRGSLDGLAYWPDEENSFFDELSTTRETELSRYDCVIHLHSPDESLGYNNDNPFRVENATQAGSLNRKIFEAWRDHPDRREIAARENFWEKSVHCLQIMKEQLAPCCSSEELSSLLGRPLG